MPNSMTDLARIATELSLATQAATLRVLEAEMQALAHMMPGSPGQPPAPLPDADEVEQGFENMPV